ncbi:hypothetical protein ACFQV2_22695 [Actinokineospora soli]|uniref:Uncharacterized protein n=1 Tax=Actinokineospora soli TaxID=1048753 RepID=A0ABW2TPZ8_9PSEU
MGADRPRPGPALLRPRRVRHDGEYLRVLRSVTGRWLPALRLPARALLPVGALADLVQPLWPWDIPVQLGAIVTCLRATAIDAPAAGRWWRPSPTPSAGCTRAAC